MTLSINFVSMPYLGLLPFLLKANIVMEALMKCFNALPRASSFSTVKNKQLEIEIETFQCPTSGFFLFYLRLFQR